MTARVSCSTMSRTVGLRGELIRGAAWFSTSVPAALRAGVGAVYSSGAGLLLPRLRRLEEREARPTGDCAGAGGELR